MAQGKKKENCKDVQRVLNDGHVCYPHVVQWRSSSKHKLVLY